MIALYISLGGKSRSCNFNGMIIAITGYKLIVSRIGDVNMLAQYLYLRYKFAVESGKNI